MKKFLAVMFGVLLVMVVPALAADSPWKQATEEFIVEAQLNRDQESEHWLVDLTGAWSHFVSDRTQIGAVTTVFRDGGEGGYGLGPWFEWNFPSAPDSKGHWFVGGDAVVLQGDLGDAATMQAATRFGRKFHVGNSSAIRLSFEAQRAVDKEDPATADSLNTVGFKIGLSLGVTPNTTVN